MLGTVLIVILVLALLGALPRWSHSREWGYAPTGGLGLVLFIVVILGFVGFVTSFIGGFIGTHIAVKKGNKFVINL